MTVALIYLPSGPAGQKVGVDDYFAAGHTLDDLLALAVTELQSPPSEDTPPLPYQATAHGLIWRKETRDGIEEKPLTNFTAYIVGDVVEDDGAEQRRILQVEASLERRTYSFTVPASEFVATNWPLQNMGARAVVYAGFGIRDHVRAAIQLLSGCVPESRVYTHTGWRRTEGGWVYLHAGGAIGANGPVSRMVVNLPDRLRAFVLPAPPSGEPLIKSIRASLATLDVASDATTVPVYGAIWRAVLGSADLSEHLYGPTGAGKTEVVALAQQHFGAGMDARNLPGAWSSTGNALEALAFAAKDALLVVDDYAPAGPLTDVQRLQRDADRVLRAQGNRSGRLRMRPDSTLRPAKPPRGLILSSGEDVPRGQSLQARLLVLELPKEGPGRLDWERLTTCQGDAANGLYAEAMAAFVRWLAPRYENVRRELKDQVATLRKVVHQSNQHRRTPEIIANLGVGLRYFLDFAQESGAVTEGQAKALWDRCWVALTSQAAAQVAQQIAGEPTRRFLDLLGAALSNGRAHVAGSDGQEPCTPKAWGWRQVTVGAGQFERDEWRPMGERIGWVQDEDLYLQPDAAYAAVQHLGAETTDRLTVSLPTLKRRLKERELLASTDTSRETITIRRTLEGVQRNVLHMNVRVLGLSPANKPDNPDIEAAVASGVGQPADMSDANSSLDVGNVGFHGGRDGSKPPTPDGNNNPPAEDVLRV